MFITNITGNLKKPCGVLVIFQLPAEKLRGSAKQIPTRTVRETPAYENEVFLTDRPKNYHALLTPGASSVKSFNFGIIGVRSVKLKLKLKNKTFDA